MSVLKNKKRVLIFLVSFIILSTIAFPTYVFAAKKAKNNGIFAGAAKGVITGDPQFTGVGVHDDLYARCIAINRKDTYVILVSLDLLGVTLTDIVIPIREGVEASYDINGDYVLIGCTHSHSAGVDVIGWTGVLTPYVKNIYKPFLIEKVVEVIGIALSNMKKASVKVGSIWVDGLTFNRRSYPEAEGPMDNELTALRFIDQEGGTIATLINWGVHPVLTMTGVSIFGVSADLSGYACRKLEEEFGGVGVYFTAACGDINPAPYFMWEDKYSSPFAPNDPAQYDAAEWYGHTLAANAVEA